jgi:hypothetical protein
VQHSGGGVRLAVAASDNATGNRVIAAIGSNFDIVHLGDPMTESETRKYIDGRLALARVPDAIRARFDDRIVHLLYRISAGIPRRVHSAASEILQEAPAETAEAAATAGAAGDRATAPTAPVDAPLAPVGSSQTLGVPSEERRESRRRAEPPEGVAVRVGSGGAPADQGRRAGEQVEVPPELSEPAAEQLVEPAAEESAEPAVEQFIEPAAEDSVEASAEDSFETELVEREAIDDQPIFDREPAIEPTLPRPAPSPSRRAIALGTLLVAFAAVAIPVIRSLLSEPRPAAVIESQADPGESMQGDLRKTGEVIELGASVAREASGETRAADRAAEPRIAQPLAVEPPLAETFGLLAVQINASPWATIEVDGINLGATPLANIPLLAGAHSFRARMPDGRVIERTVEIDAERRFISFE